VSGAVWAVVPAGGSGSRFSSSEDKLLADLNGQPVLIHTLHRLLQIGGLQSIVLVAGEHTLAHYQALVENALPDAPVRFALGGASRRASVYQGLLAVPEEAGVVLVHDAARPLLPIAAVTEAIRRVKAGQPGAIVAVPVQDTIKRAGNPGEITETVDRQGLWRAQTPQVFRQEILRQAHRSVPAETDVTDDAQLLELASLGPVALIPGAESNLKITTPADLHLAEALLRAGLGS